MFKKLINMWKRRQETLKEAKLLKEKLIQADEEEIAILMENVTKRMKAAKAIGKKGILISKRDINIQMFAQAIEKAGLFFRNRAEGWIIEML